MFKLKEGQHRTIVFHDDKYYTCIYDSNNELVSYEDMPYLYVNEEGYETIDIDKFNKNLNSILEYDFLDVAKHVKNMGDYTELVHKLESFLYTSNDIMSLTNWMINDDGWDVETTKEFYGCCKTMMQKMLYNEDILKQLSKQVPTNWAYAMFEGSSYTREPWLTTHRIASGQTEFYASDKATNMDLIKKWDYQESLDKFICLQKAIKDKYGWIPKKVTIGEKELEVDDIQAVGQYYAIKGAGEQEYYLADSCGIRVSDETFENPTIIKAISTRGNIDCFEIIEKWEDNTTSKRILSVAHQDDKVTSTLSGSYSSIERVDNGFICKGEIVLENNEYVEDSDYQYIENVVGNDGDVQLKQSPKYKYMAYNYSSDCKERGIYLQMEEYGNYHRANIENGEIASLEETDMAIIDIGINKFNETEYRDTLGRVHLVFTPNDTKLSEQFVQYYSNKISLQDLDEKCFAEPEFTLAVLETEKKKIEKQIMQTQDEEKIEELSHLAEQTMQQIRDKRQKILEMQEMERKRFEDEVSW